MSMIPGSNGNVSQVQSLQNQIQSLQQKLEEKNEAIFELSATLASVKAETDYKVARMQKQLDTNNTAATTSSTGVAAAVTPAAMTTMTASPTPETLLVVTRNSPKTGVDASPLLARHIMRLYGGSSDLPPNLLLLLQSNPPDQQLILSTLETCVRRDIESSKDSSSSSSSCNCCWNLLREMFSWSKTARRHVRRALHTHTASSSTVRTVKQSRISRAGVALSCDSITLALREPLGVGWSGHDNTTSTTTNHDTDAPPRPYLRNIAKQWKKELLTFSSVLHAQTLAALLVDASLEERLAWQEELCGAKDAPLVVLLTSLLLLKTGSRSLRRRRTVLLPSDSSTATTSSTNTTTTTTTTTTTALPSNNRSDTLETAIVATQVLRDCGGWACTREREDMSRFLMGLWLDLLEQEYCDLNHHSARGSHHGDATNNNNNTALTLVLLQTLQQTLCQQHTVLRAMRWFRTQMALQDDWACSGVGVVVRCLFCATTVVVDDDDDDEAHAVSSECVRILHGVLRHLQQERQRAEEANVATFVSFLSVVSEQKERYKSALHSLLVKEPPGSDVSKLVQLQLEEIAMDEEEEEELKNAQG